jgi:RNA polymerase sigma factor (sigma-70 family)
LEVMSMDPKLLTEARAIAARRDPRAADDLAQELACAALQAGAGVAGAGVAGAGIAGVARPAAWLERVARNAVIDGRRAQQRREQLAPRVEPPAAPADPETVLLARERRGLVRRALALLPRPQRRAALLRFHADLPFDGVAERLGTREVTARTRVHRALASLRSRLDGLRSMFVLPGAQTAVLGLTLIAVQQLPAAPSPLAIAGADVVAAVQHPKRRAAVRVMAEAKPAAHDAEPRPDARDVPAVQRFVFGDEAVLGDVKGPDGERLVVVPRVVHSSLIEIRQHFVPEMVKGLEDL